MDTTKLFLVHVGLIHVPDLMDLYKKVFKRTVAPSYFSKKYGLKDDRRIQCSTIAIYGDDVIGFVGCKTMEYYDHTRRTAVSLLYACDFILLEEYRGKGVFDLLYAHTLKKAKEEEFECIFALQSDQTYKFCKRMGWEDGRPFERFVIPFREKKAAKLLTVLRGEERMTKLVNSAMAPYLLDAELDQFNRFEDCYSRKLDSSFRYEMENPSNRHLVLIGGAVLWLRYNGQLVAGMVRFLNDFKPEHFLSELKKVFRPTGIRDLTFHVQQRTNEHHMLSSFLPAEKSFKVSYLKTFEDGCHVDELAISLMDSDMF